MNQWGVGGDLLNGNYFRVSQRH